MNLKNWTEKGPLLIAVLLISIGAIIIGWLLGGWVLITSLIITIVAILFLARRIWISDKSNFLLRSATVAIVSLAILSSNSFVWNFIAAAVNRYFPEIHLPTNDLPPATLLFLLFFTFLIFYFTRDTSGFGKTEKPIDKLIEEPTIKQKWENVCRGLEAQIRDIDRETNWSNEYYTPLEAEVEMRTSVGTKKVVKDLLGAIKQSNDRLFLLIGDPGAGKSVSLRKLSLDILKDSIKTEYIPIYVNLKEWATDQDWTVKPPTWKDLEDFVKESLGNRDRHLADFFDKHYDVLDENGNLFFILDSFDEIPQVLGTTAESKLIDDLTKVCREFLVGAKQPRSRGILASREYRMPRADYLEANTMLRVRPFTYEKIEQTLLQSGKVSKEAVEHVFRERRDLIPILRNPFITSLLQNYLVDNYGAMPNSQAELFSDYIEKSIEKAQRKVGKTSLSLEEIVAIATQIAKIIFSESGLQAPLSLLRKQVQHPDFDEIITLLRYTRIARGNVSGTDMFSFAHRRFYEYFVVRDLLSHKTLELPLESIPTDSRWRDTLILYCEVAPFEQAQRIANYCWYEVIDKNKSIRHRDSKHCLRFLSEAYKGRLDCLRDFRQALAKFILSQIHPENDPIDIKIAVEALGILSQKNIDKGAVKAFQLKDSWINDTALRSCRHLDSISTDLEKALLHIIDSRFLPYEPFWFNLKFSPPKQVKMSNKELLFSFSLSDTFKELRLIVEWQSKEHNHIKNLGIALIPFLLIFAGLIYTTTEQVLGGSRKVDPPFILKISLWVYTPFLLIYWFVYPIILKFTHFSVSHKIRQEQYYVSYRSIGRSLLRFIKQIPIGMLISLILFSILLLISVLIDSDIIFEGFVVFIIFIGWPIMIFQSIAQRRNRVKYKAVYVTICKNGIEHRDEIYHAYNNLSKSREFLEKFIIYLENNVKQVVGEYPDGFLKVGQGSMMTRLIQLEEKWREVEEREIEEARAAGKGK